MSKIDINDIEPRADWSSDCQGKKDYDGELLSISSRYWPPHPIFNKTHDAKASIHLNLGKPEEGDGGGKYVEWRAQEFSADTFEGVKALVEKWVKEQVQDVIRILGVDLTKVQ